MRILNVNRYTNSVFIGCLLLTNKYNLREQRGLEGRYGLPLSKDVGTRERLLASGIICLLSGVICFEASLGANGGVDFHLQYSTVTTCLPSLNETNVHDM